MAAKLSDGMKNHFVGMHMAGKSMNEVMDISGAPKQEVQGVLEQFHEEGNINTKPGSDKMLSMKKFQFELKIFPKSWSRFVSAVCHNELMNLQDLIKRLENIQTEILNKYFLIKTCQGAWERL